MVNQTTRSSSYATTRGGAIYSRMQINKNAQKIEDFQSAIKNRDKLNLSDDQVDRFQSSIDQLQQENAIHGGTEETLDTQAAGIKVQLEETAQAGPPVTVQMKELAQEHELNQSTVEDKLAELRAELGLDS